MSNPNDNQNLLQKFFLDGGVSQWLLVVIALVVPVASVYVTFSTQLSDLRENQIVFQERMLQKDDKINDLNIKMNQMKGDFEEGMQGFQEFFTRQMEMMEGQNTKISESIQRLDRQSLELEFLIQQVSSRNRPSNNELGNG